MKMRILFIKTLFAVCLFFAGNTTAQTAVELHITHKLAGKKFAFDTVAQNNLGNDFTVTRVQYYLSNIKIKHDGGMITPVPNHYILVDGAVDLVDTFGSLNVTNVEAITFSVGVDSVRNHSDPTLYPHSHPLALKLPTMHWGWASGYFFVTMEGNSGTDLSKIWNLHALGDQNYFETTVPVSSQLLGGRIVIPIQAEYAEALKGITVSSGLAVHGDDAEAVTLLQNFQSSVFSAGTPVGINALNQANVNINVYPNPSLNNTVSVSFENITGKAVVEIYDLQGRLITSANKGLNDKTVSLRINNSGLYMVKVQPENGNAIVRKLEIR